MAKTKYVKLIKTIKRFGTGSAHIILPVRYLGHEVSVSIKTEKKRTKGDNNERVINQEG